MRWDDGRIEIDNNAAECAAAIYSLVGTAKLNGVDPEGTTASASRVADLVA